MRVKYHTRGIVLARLHSGEANSTIVLLTPDVGLVYARAQGVRKSGAKLAPALGTLAENICILVRGKEGWRITGAVLEDDWFSKLPSFETRSRAARISSLVARLVVGEERDHALYPIIISFLKALATLPEESHESIEILAALRILTVLGLDIGEVPIDDPLFGSDLLATIQRDRVKYIARINNGIAASGL